MPRKMAGSAMSTIDWLMKTIRVPRVMFERAIHLYRPSGPPVPGSGPAVDGAPAPWVFRMAIS